MHFRLLFFSFFLLSVNLYAQQPYHTYTLNGTINTDTGTIFLDYGINGEKETKVVDGKFTFTDSIDYPTSARLFLRINADLVYISGRFYIDPGPQTITCNRYDSLRRSPEISNKTTTEYKDDYVKTFTDIRIATIKQAHIRDSIRSVYHKIVPDEIAIPLAKKEDSLTNEYHSKILYYTEQHPNSYVVLWSIIDLLKDAYYPIYNSIYYHLSTDVKNSPPGKNLAEKLIAAHAIQVGSKFPHLPLNNMADSSIILHISDKKKSYTLVDFWFSHCGPCRQQFPSLKKIYDTYKTNGFEIIGISVDQTEDAVKDWKKVITDLEMDWPQYRDKDEINAKKLSIQSYPTNFLLDRNGVIIKRNISPEELEKLLAKEKNPD